MEVSQRTNHIQQVESTESHVKPMKRKNYYKIAKLIAKQHLK